MDGILYLPKIPHTWYGLLSSCTIYDEREKIEDVPNSFTSTLKIDQFTNGNYNSSNNNSNNRASCKGIHSLVDDVFHG